jgi:hypothetical protein
LTHAAVVVGGRFLILGGIRDPTLDGQPLKSVMPVGRVGLLFLDLWERSGRDGLPDKPLQFLSTAGACIGF